MHRKFGNVQQFSCGVFSQYSTLFCCITNEHKGDPYNQSNNILTWMRFVVQLNECYKQQIVFLDDYIVIQEQKTGAVLLNEEAV